MLQEVATTEPTVLLWGGGYTRQLSDASHNTACYRNTLRGFDHTKANRLGGTACTKGVHFHTFRAKEC
jgi:hypothetical protein